MSFIMKFLREFIFIRNLIFRTMCYEGSFAQSSVTLD